MGLPCGVPCVPGHMHPLCKSWRLRILRPGAWGLQQELLLKDLGVAVQGSQSRAQFSNWLCYELTPSCKKKPPPLPKDRWYACLLGCVAMCVVQLSSA